MDFTAAVRWLCEVQPQFWSWNDVKPTLLRPFETGYAVSVLNVILAPNGAAMQKHEMAIDTSSDLDDQQLELSAPPTTQVVRPTAVSRSPRCNTYIQFEYQIVFNSTYLVPQLLFLASRLDGTPLSLEELLPQLSMSCSNTQHVLDLSFDWRFVTQVVHQTLLQMYCLMGSRFLGAPFLANTILHHPPLQNNEFDVVGVVELRRTRSSSKGVSGNS